MLVTRRDAVLKLLFGAGMLGLRSFATGIPMAILANPRRALAQSQACASATGNSCPSIANPQFLILNVSQKGDPINANAPGCFIDPKIPHSTDPSMAPGTTPWNGLVAAKPWVDFGTTPYASRTNFFHHATLNSIHPGQPSVLYLNNSIKLPGSNSHEMMSSFFAAQLAPCLNTVQPQPIALGTYEGSSDPLESVAFAGTPQPMLPPTVLAQVLGDPSSLLSDLDTVRETDLDALNKILRTAGSATQQTFIDQYATSRTQMRSVCQSLLQQLNDIKDNYQDSQLIAAQVLFQMRVCPAVTVHIYFGDDNHSDAGYVQEAAQHVAGVASITTALGNLASANMLDKVTFASLNGMGRTLDKIGGRDHNGNHAVGFLIGANINSGVVGGVTGASGGGSAVNIDSTSGTGASAGDINANDSLVAYAMTLGSALGVPLSTMKTSMTLGQSGTAKIVQSAVKSVT